MTTIAKDSKNRKLEDEHEVGDNEEERKRNSLRCDDANIKVIVGGEQGEENEDGDGGGNIVRRRTRHQ
jgi:hypothetical protein